MKRSFDDINDSVYFERSLVNMMTKLKVGSEQYTQIVLFITSIEQ